MLQDRGFSYVNPLGEDVDIPEAGLPPERLAELTEKIREGRESKDERDEVANSYIRLAIAVAGQYAASIPSKADDFLQCALFGVVKGLSEARFKLRDDNLTAYLVSKMHSTCKNYRQSDHVFRVPARTNSRRKSNGKEMVTFNRRGMSEIGEKESALSDDDEYVRKGSDHAPHDTTWYHEADHSDDLKELIYSLAADDIDREIIDLRLEYYRDEEIAELMGLSRSFVQNRRYVIQQKYERVIK